jgi:hypothetical protein
MWVEVFNGSSAITNTLCRPHVSHDKMLESNYMEVIGDWDHGIKIGFSMANV